MGGRKIISWGALKFCPMINGKNKNPRDSGKADRSSKKCFAIRKNGRLAKAKKSVLRTSKVCG